MGPLTQEEADTLREIEKILINPHKFRIPLQGKTEEYPVCYQIANMDKDNMSISAFHGNKDIFKVSIRLKYNGNIILTRIDSRDQTRHINPDKTIIEALQPHIHIYREGYDDKFAYPLPREFSDATNVCSLFRDFLSYSHVINLDEIRILEQGALFYDG